MVGVEVALMTVVAFAQLGEHSIRWGITKAKSAAVGNNIRFPTAIHASPTIALEAQYPQPPVLRTVPSLGGGAAPEVLLVPLFPAVRLAAAIAGELGTAGD